MAEVPPHKDTSGDYEQALAGLVSGEAGITADHPAPAAAKHPWLAKITPALSQYGPILSQIEYVTLTKDVHRLTAHEHLGNYVATTRGPNPAKTFESMPIYVRIGMHLLYSEYDSSLLGMKRIKNLLKEQSIAQGKAFDSEEGAFEHIKAFVATYNIDCSELLKPNIADYKTFNEFFARELRPGARPIDEANNPAVISSCADCRLTVFQNVDLAKEFWIKGKGFTLAALLGDESLAAGFEGGEIAIFRLSPADYHRYNSPVDCVVGPTKSIEGDYYTVNPVTVNEKNCDVFTQNRRDVTILSMPNEGSTPTDVAFVQVGAMLVGSIVRTKNQSDVVKRGEELGYYKYGGSTNIFEAMVEAIQQIKHSISMTEHVASPPKPDASPVGIASEFLLKMQAAFDAQNADAIVGLFTPDGWWRDILNIDFDMNSLKTSEIKGHLTKFGIPAITHLAVTKPNDASFSEAANWIQAFTTYETDIGRGKGYIRLRESAPGQGDWKAYTFFTAFWEIKGHEEFAYERRPNGADHGEKDTDALRQNWLERRQEAVKFKNTDPTVLIVGGGQNGLMLAARLTALGVPNLIVEKNERIGDSWRKRYHTLCLHDPVWADALPYVPYPRIMELNVWLESTISADPTFDDATKKWTVVVNKEGVPSRTMQVSQLVLASGFSGEARLPTFPMDEFKGTTYHSSTHPGGRGWAGKKAVVVGCCNSGHDISADFYENGADNVMSSKHGIPGLLAGFYEEGGPPTEDADIMLTSLPIDVVAEFHQEATKDIAIKDKEILDGLKAVGFKLNPYADGLFIKYFRDGGGYYIDVGASQLIADGKIKIKQGKEIKKLTKDGVLFEDGVELKADIVVFATGYSSMRETVRRVISEKVANGLGPCWGKDAQGEIPGVWRNSGVDHFWLMCGNMFQARCFSKHVALQIQMQELGVKSSTQAEFPMYKNVADPRF
ncbi:hypothetical protein RQP46_002262 [Phenoliferia psychrophenolica]